MGRGLVFGLATFVSLTPSSTPERLPLAAQTRAVRELVADLRASDAEARARAACELRERGDSAAEAVQPLVLLLADAAPVSASVCPQRWWRGDRDDLTSPGEQAATALVAIGSRSFQPVLAALRDQQLRRASLAAAPVDEVDSLRVVHT